MQPLPSRTRSSTLQDRLDTYQNGSTSVRSTVQLAEELHPVHRETGGEENLELGGRLLRRAEEPRVPRSS